MPAPRPRRTRADGEQSRATILRTAAALATVTGLDGLTLGELARAVGMSKSGLYAHFGSKEDLQLATVDEARRVFDDEVFERAAAVEPGRARLLALSEAFFVHLERRTFPGGCFFVGAALEMGTRPGRVKDRILDFQQELSRVITANAAVAIEHGELSPDEDPVVLAFELNSVIVGADAAFVLRDDSAVLEVARAVVRRRLAPPT